MFNHNGDILTQKSQSPTEKKKKSEFSFNQYGSREHTPKSETTIVLFHKGKDGFFLISYKLSHRA